MPADWSTPASLSTLYEEVLDFLKARDVDAITLQVAAPSNLPIGAIKWNRANNRFQEWDGAAFDDMVLSIESGGTGAITAAAARTALGLGSMAVQNSTAVSISGGSIAGVTMAASVLTSGQVALARGGTGASLALGANGSVLQSNGAGVVFGVDGSQFINLSATQLTSGSVPAARLPITSLVAGQLAIGSLYFNGSVSTDPATLLGYGTWARFGSGKVIVSQDITDVDFDVAGDVGGSKTRTLLRANLPAEGLNTNVHQQTGGGASPALTLGSLGAEVVSENLGSGTAFSLMNPFIVAYCWIRTA